MFIESAILNFGELLAKLLQIKHENFTRLAKDIFECFDNVHAAYMQSFKHYIELITNEKGFLVSNVVFNNLKSDQSFAADVRIKLNQICNVNTKTKALEPLLLAIQYYLRYPNGGPFGEINNLRLGITENLLYIARVDVNELRESLRNQPEYLRKSIEHAPVRGFRTLKMKELTPRLLEEYRKHQAVEAIERASHDVMRNYGRVCEEYYLLVKRQS
jgi:hypothetical protein